jgi:hypothetical protein
VRRIKVGHRQFEDLKRPQALLAERFEEVSQMLQLDRLPGQSLPNVEGVNHKPAAQRLANQDSTVKAAADQNGKVGAGGESF